MIVARAIFVRINNLWYRRSTKLGYAVRYPSIELDITLEIAEHIEI
jgi:hypothetical protein